MPEQIAQTEEMALAFKVACHFADDMRKKGFYVTDVGLDSFNFSRRAVGYERGFDAAQEPFAVAKFRTEIRAHQEVLYAHIPENLENYRGFKGIRNLSRGVSLLLELQRWGDEHGTFLKRSDNQGDYTGPHDERAERRNPDGGIIRIYSIHPEIYKD